MGPAARRPGPWRRKTKVASFDFLAMVVTGSPIHCIRLELLHRRAHELPDLIQVVGAHGRMEAFGVRAAYREQAKARFGSERHERDRADLDGANSKEIVALCVANLPAARPCRFEKCVKGLELCRLTRRDAQ